MTSRAAIAAQLVDVRNVGQHKCVKLTIHVPAEQAGLVMAAFGWPTMVDPVVVAIARLDPNKVGVATPEREADKDQIAPSGPSASRKPVAPDKRLAQCAGILCSDPIFHKWLGEISRISDVTEEDAATYVRSKCGVISRSEIIPGSDAAIAFDELYAQFIVWRDADEYVEAAE